MIGQEVSHYKIAEKIGEGGMGEVYKARDTKLERDVALKFLPSSITPSEEDRQRFKREAKAAAALNHPNICTIHSIDDYEDTQYIVMEYVEGETLRTKINSGELSLEESLKYALQIAEALKEAHGQNIIHRDIKPENIMIDKNGLIKIMDFGLAKFKQAGDITKTGDTVGTAAYMSPEQAGGEEIDHRTDIWSFGVVMFEMLTGKKPFSGEYSQAVIYSIINEEPEQITEVNPNIPDELNTIILKALEKRKEDRFKSVEVIQKDLKHIRKTFKSDYRPAKPLNIISTLKKRLLQPLPLVTCLVLIVAAIGYFMFKPQEKVAFQQRDWMMITDFNNQTEQEEFGDFLNTVLEVGLTQSSYVNIYERNETLNILRNEMDMKDVKTLTNEVIKKAAAHEDIRTILTPAIKRNDSAYTLTANIRNIKSNNSMEVEPVQATSKDSILYAMDKLTKRIRLRLGESPSKISEKHTPIVKATTSSLKALKLYAEGMRIKHSDESTGYDLIEQAVQLDPQFALAHAELGKYYYINGNNQKGEQHFQKALSQLDRLTLREQLWIKALAAEWRGKKETAIERYKTYLSQYPDDYTAWFRLGYTYLTTGKEEKCIDAYRRVVEFEPRNSYSLVNLATCYNSKGDNENALKYYRKTFEISPQMKKQRFINNEFGFLLVEMGKLEEARETFKLLLEDSELKSRGHRHLGLLNSYNGNFSKAIDHFKKAIVLNQSQDVPLSEYRNRLYLVRSYEVKGMENEFNKEVKEIEKLIDQMKLSPSWLSKAGVLFARNDLVDKAQQILRKIEDSLGETDVAAAVNRDLSEDEAFYHWIKGEIALKRRNEDTALESLKIAYNILDDPNPLAHFYYKTGNLDKAITYYEKAIEKYDLGSEGQLKWILAHFYLGDIYQKQGKSKQAIKYYEQLIELWENGDEDLWPLQEARKQLEILK
ncbi:MAG: protein kinase domain-containing protein [Candidatus Halalkalibacterium sp. M3_1C_030]